MSRYREIMRRIIVSQETREKLRTVFDVSDKTVSFALNYRSDNELAQKIRMLALQNGGKSTGGDMETFFAENYLVQRFGADVEIRVDLTNDATTLSKRGKVIKELKNTKIEELMRLQQKAQLLSQVL